MDKKCAKYLAKLAQRFNDQNLPNDQLLKIFKQAIDSLPKSKIKTNLLQNNENHFQIFQRYFDNKPNKYTTSEFVLEDTNSVIGNIISNQKNQTKLNSILNDVVNKLQLSATERQEIVTKLCNLALTLTHSNILYAITHTLFRYFETKLDELLTKKCDVKELENITNEMLKVLTLLPDTFQRKNFSHKKVSDFFDVISSILSLYIDATSNISRLNCDNDKVKGKTGNRLIELINIVLGLNSSKYIDTLLQITSIKNPKYHSLLAPLYVYFFTRTTISLENLSVIRYLQIMLVIRQGLSVVDKKSECTKKILEISGQCAAPESFHAWVISRVEGSNLLDMTPLTEASTPREITEYLLKEAEIEILEDFVDLYHEPKFEEKQVKTNEINPIENISDKELFEIVTTGDNVLTTDNNNIIMENIEDIKLAEESEYLLDDKLFEISTKGSLIFANNPDLLSGVINHDDHEICDTETSDHDNISDHEVDDHEIIDNENSDHEKDDHEISDHENDNHENSDQKSDHGMSDHDSSDVDEKKLLEDTKHLLDNETLKNSETTQNNTAENSQVASQDNEVLSRLRTTPKRKARQAKNEPIIKVSKVNKSLFCIPEDNSIVNNEEVAVKTFYSERKLRSRSDSESSAGSNHSYMTRSRKTIK